MRLLVMFTLSVLSVTLLGCLSKPIKLTSVRGDFVVEIWASSDCVQPGDTIKLRATVTNKGTADQVVELSDQPVLDIVIRNQGPSIRWSDGKSLTPDLTRLELKPGESKSIEMEWKAKTPSPGYVFYVDARFIDDARFANDPVRPGITVSVSVCPGPFGP